MELTIQLTDEQAARIQAMAGELGIQADEVLHAAVAELLSGPSDGVKESIERILVEDGEPYRQDD